MNKQIILDALASQFATKQNEFEQYETTVYNPALVRLNQSIHDWFSSVLSISPYNVKYTENTLEIVPTEDGRWPSAINIRKQYSYRDDEDNYYDIDYRSSHTKINTTNMYYLTVLGKVAQHVALIIDNIENEWKPAYKEIYKPYWELNSELYKLEQEINRVKQEIHQNNREAYKEIGFQHTISPQLMCEVIDYSTSNYELVSKPKYFNLTTGRGRWDYTSVVEYRVIGLGKYNRIQLMIKDHPDRDWMNVEIKQDYFDEFIADVYQWEASGKQLSDESQTQRFERYSERAKQTA
jgi:hypothetical protein